MKITTVTPWLNHPELATGFLKAMQLGPEPDDMIVVDNGSEPAISFAAIRNEENLGFSGASNQGLMAATTDAVLFLNNDITATRPGWLQTIRDALEPGFLVGARLRRDPHTAVDGIEIPYLDGWCIAGMREDLLELGGWDSELDEPAYFSDNLLCLEARALGFSLREVNVGLKHAVGATAKQDPRSVKALEANHARYLRRARELLVTA